MFIKSSFSLYHSRVEPTTCFHSEQCRTTTITFSNKFQEHSTLMQITYQHNHSLLSLQPLNNQPISARYNPPWEGTMQQKFEPQIAISCLESASQKVFATSLIIFNTHSSETQNRTQDGFRSHVSVLSWTRNNWWNNSNLVFPSLAPK